MKKLENTPYEQNFHLLSLSNRREIADIAQEIRELLLEKEDYRTEEDRAIEIKEALETKISEFLEKTEGIQDAFIKKVRDLLKNYTHRTRDLVAYLDNLSSSVAIYSRMSKSIEKKLKENNYLITSPFSVVQGFKSELERLMVRISKKIEKEEKGKTFKILEGKKLAKYLKDLFEEETVMETGEVTETESIRILLEEFMTFILIEIANTLRNLSINEGRDSEIESGDLTVYQIFEEIKWAINIEVGKFWERYKSRVNVRRELEAHRLMGEVPDDIDESALN